jgi:putative nucleotidyltransferase with HDIG domain
MHREYIRKLLPEISRIREAKLRDGVIDVWLLAAEKGGWDKIDDIPFTLLAKTKRTLIQHTRSVTKMAIAVAEARGDLNTDIIVAAGLVHDVGKLLEYSRKRKTITKSPHGKLVRHPVSGYGLAIEVGLPLAVAHVIAAHSKEGEGGFRSKEAIVIHHCDFIDFDIERAG